MKRTEVSYENGFRVLIRDAHSQAAVMVIAPQTVLAPRSAAKARNMARDRARFFRVSSLSPFRRETPHGP